MARVPGPRGRSGPLTSTGAGPTAVEPPGDPLPPAEPSREGLSSRAARGAAVTLTGQGLRIVIQVGGVAVLSRLLSPEDYGLLAMTTVIVGVADIFRDMGLSAAAVQARTLSHGQRSNLFWINSGMGLVLALLVFAAAPVLAAVYDRTALIDIARVLCWSFLINGVATQFRAHLTRSLAFGRLAVVDIAGSLVGLGAGVLAALGGAGTYALVVQQLTQNGLILLLSVAAARWLPGLPDRQAPMRGLLTYGWNLIGSQLIGYAGNNVDSLTIGTRFGASPLGLYNRAFQLVMTPLNSVRGPINQVGLPVFARVQDDPARLGRAMVRAQSALGWTLVLGLAVLAGSAGPITGVLLGPAWGEAAPLIALLAASGALQTVGLVNYWVYLAGGLTRELLRYSLVQGAIRVVCILVGSTFGVVGVAIGYAVAPALEWPLSFWWLNRLRPIPARQLLLGGVRVVSIAVIGGAGSWVASAAASGLPTVAQLALAVVAGPVVAVAVGAALPTTRRDLVDVLGVARSVVRRGPR